MTEMASEVPHKRIPIIDETPSEQAPKNGIIAEGFETFMAEDASLKEQAPTPVVSPMSNSAEEDGPQPAISKREAIRMRLREKERQLNEMMSTPRAQQTVGSAENLGNSYDDGSTIEEDVSLTEPTNIVRTVGKEDADRREAVRVLSQAALHMKQKLNKQMQETLMLQRNLNALTSSLTENEEQKLLLHEELEQIKLENKKKQEEIAQVQKALEEKSLKLKRYETINVAEKEMDLQNQLTAAYEEVVWTQKDSMSKAEQLEYFEYQLLAKNHEIDDMKQELNAKLRQIVELEVDLEIHDDRFSTSLDMYSRTESAALSASITTGENLSVRKEMIIDNPPPMVEERQRGSVGGGIRKMLSFRRKSNRSLAASKVGFDNDSSYSYVDQMHSEFKNLEARYKKDKFASRMQIDQLKQENNEYLIKVLSLEKSLQNEKAAKEPDESPRLDQQFTRESLRNIAAQDETGELLPAPSVDVSDADQSEMLPNRAAFMKESIESLKNEVSLQTRTNEKLQAEIKLLNEEAAKTAIQHEQALQVLRLENQTKDLKLAALQRELHDISQTTNRSIKGLHVNAAAGLEIKLQQNLTEIVRLRKEQEVKNKKIDSLRAEIIELRLIRMQYEKARQGSGEGGAGARLEPITEDAGIPSLFHAARE